jgi:hypothetical protein
MAVCGGVKTVPEEIGVGVDGEALRGRGDVGEALGNGWPNEGVEESVGVELEDVEAGVSSDDLCEPPARP